MMWGGRRYHSLDHYLKTRFGSKLYKLTLDGGMTCPNRDGSLSAEGCIFCSGGSGAFAARKVSSVEEQLSQAKQMIADKFDGDRYIAYFQSFTNTYAPVQRLSEIYMPVLQREEIAVLDIATRPDCLEEEKLELLGQMAQLKPVWVELGLQTANENTAVQINRCYPNEVYRTAVTKLHEKGIEVITHIILGLPGESLEDMLQTAAFAAECGSDGIKLQLLHVLEGTKLAELYRLGQVPVMTEEEYVAAVGEILRILPGSMVIHRLTGDGVKEQTLAPIWSGHKRHVLNHINHYLKEKGICQGCGISSDLSTVGTSHEMYEK